MHPLSLYIENSQGLEIKSSLTWVMCISTSKAGLIYQESKPRTLKSKLFYGTKSPSSLDLKVILLLRMQHCNSMMNNLTCVRDGAPSMAAVGCVGVGGVGHVRVSLGCLRVASS